MLDESEGVNDAFRRSPGSPFAHQPLPRPARLRLRPDLRRLEGAAAGLTQEDGP
ncbi:hypothetical protein phiCbK_192 [Caulobacter phage phiCbK]|uniref:Uncharacterized protein n=2 Tax=Viruses TaxID=10239 RepID=J3SKZ4_9CAUD|nr:hypothetical protein phiCbK_192 [Caulobacter phage phiCbK]